MLASSPPRPLACGRRVGDHPRLLFQAPEQTTSPRRNVRINRHRDPVLPHNNRGLRRMTSVEVETPRRNLKTMGVSQALQAPSTSSWPRRNILPSHCSDAINSVRRRHGSSITSTMGRIVLVVFPVHFSLRSPCYQSLR